MIGWRDFCIAFVMPLCITAYIVNPGPVVKATKGQVWPIPEKQDTTTNFLIINPTHFEFQTNVPQCSLLTNALNRYWNIINNHGVGNVRQSQYNEREITEIDGYSGKLSSIKVYLKTNCTGDEVPSDTMDESYEIDLMGVPSTLIAPTIWGAIRGLETISQLIYYAEDGSTLILNTTKISDKPRFPFRGLLVDTSRHFIPKDILLKNLDAMAYNKLNVFHWHLTDDHSFPYQSIKFPELSQYGAYHPSALIYTQQDVKDIIEYARQRGIRVMTEFDTPGHTRSWGEGVSDILTPCYENNAPTGMYGPLDPSADNVYTFIKEFFEEIISVFPENYVHLGGDEVGFECWESNPKITQFMKDNNMVSYVALESYYIQKLLDIVHDLGGKSLVWEEVFVNGVELPNKTIVHVWKGDGYTVLKKTIAAGKPALLSSCWYLDYLKTGGDWDKFYECDPHNVNATEEELELILGGEACMWSESVNKYNFMSRVWPRASAAAEKLWSRKDAATYSEAAQRLEEHTCRMNARGIEAQPPNGPGYCL